MPASELPATTVTPTPVFYCWHTSPHPTTCDNCAALAVDSFRATRSGAFDLDAPANLLTSFRAFNAFNAFNAPRGRPHRIGALRSGRPRDSWL